ATGAPLPRAWEEVILACLAKDSARRPSIAGEVARRLMSVEVDAPRQKTARFEERDAHPNAQAARPAEKESAPSKSKASFLAVVVAAVLLGVGAGYYFGV